jgi:hypothetical protein
MRPRSWVGLSGRFIGRIFAGRWDQVIKGVGGIRPMAAEEKANLIHHMRRSASY